jgi:glycosyltransferase involved in cell wall biosynthesis
LKKRNVLFLASWYPTRIHETSGNFNEKFAQTLATVHAVFVLHVIADQAASKKEEIVIKEEGQLKTVLIYFRKKERETFLDKILKAYRYFHYYKKGFKLISDRWGRPEIVHNNVLFPVGLFALYLKNKLKIQYITTAHWTGYLNYRNTNLSWMRRFLTKKIARNAARICPVTDHLQQGMEQFDIYGDYETVPNVVNSNIFFPSEQSRSARTRFLHVSNCKDGHKNITGMLRAFDQLAGLYPDVRLHIITEESLDELNQLIELAGFQNRNCLSIEGRQPAEKIAEAMRDADCFVLFSNFETFSVVIAEAWSCGIPAIYSKCGGLTEINNTALGIQISPKDELALLDAMKSVLEQKTSFNKKEILKQAQAYSADAVLGKFSDIYDSILEN